MDWKGDHVLIVFDSKTGNVKRFVSKLGLKSVQITENLVINQPYILITYTTGVGQVPQSTLMFLERNNQFLMAVATSGNMNWGTRYGLAADHVARMYSVPILMKFELSGTKKDVEKFIQEVSNIVTYTKVDSA